MIVNLKSISLIIALNISVAQKEKKSEKIV